MLLELAVQNLAVIEDVRVELAPGFCAWTGETGAGKSLLLSAIGLLLGERGSAELIRAEHDELRITGRFELSRKEQRTAAEEILKSELVDGELVLTRRLSRTGRSSALVNEHPVSVSTLRRIGEMLVDVHGQRESYSLLQPSYQLELLDAFGKLTEQRRQYVAAAERLRELRKNYRQLMEARQQRQRELALIRFEREELDSAAIQEGESERIQREREKLLHAQSLAAFTANVAERLTEDEHSISVILTRLIKDANKWAAFDADLTDVAKRLNLIKPEVQDLAETCRSLSENYEADPERLEQIEHRLQLFHKLEAKYGKALSELIEYHRSLELKERDLQLQEDELSQLLPQLESAFHELSSVAKTLSKARGKVAKKLASETQKHLVDLGMPKAILHVQLETVELPRDPLSCEIPQSGIDHMEIHLAANPGEPSRPLRKVASGGELSRAMLALKTVLAAHDPVRTLVVFDEIDANVGGRLGDVLGQKLAMLGATHQVLCVTHLPQVAAYAKHQWTIRKQTRGKKTSTTIVPLNRNEDRVEELAIMLRGETRSETTRKEAREMLRANQSQQTDA